MSEQNTDKFIDNILALVQAIITLFALPFMVLTRYGMGASVVGWLNALGATFLISMYSYGWGGAPLRSLATLVFLLCMAHFYIAMRLKHYGKHIHTKHIGFIYGQRTIASMVDQRLKRLPGQRSFELAVFREVITHSGLIMYCVFYTIIIFLEARVDRYEYIQAEPTLGTVLFGTARLGQESLRVETGAWRFFQYMKVSLLCSIIVYFLSRWNSEKLFLQVLDDGWIANDLALRQEQVERNALVGDHKAFQFVHAGLAHGMPPGERPERPPAEQEQPETAGSEQEPEATQPPPKEPSAPPQQPGT